MDDTTHKQALPAGHRLGGYRVERVLGVGGFGVTYLAEHASLGHRAAVKEYLPNDFAVRDGTEVHPKSKADREDFEWGLDRFLGEAKTLARFEHRGIVRVRDIFEANRTAYLVMDYEDGEPLDRILERRGRLTEAQLLRVVLPVVDGLREVHAAGFLHRDVKPSNVYVRRADESPVLLDFGAARQALGRRSKSLTAVVSAGYSPPEQYESEGEQGPWTDVYALSALCYRAITGKVPVEAPRRQGMLLRGKPDPLPRLAENPPDRFSPALLQSVDHGLSVIENERPQSLDEWCSEFRYDTAERKPVRQPEYAPRAHTPAQRVIMDPGVRRPVDRRRLVAASAAGAAVVLVAVWWLYSAGETPVLGRSGEPSAAIPSAIQASDARGGMWIPTADEYRRMNVEANPWMADADDETLARAAYKHARSKGVIVGEGYFRSRFLPPPPEPPGLLSRMWSGIGDAASAVVRWFVDEPEEQADAATESAPLPQRQPDTFRREVDRYIESAINLAADQYTSPDEPTAAAQIPRGDAASDVAEEPSMADARRGETTATADAGKQAAATTAAVPFHDASCHGAADSERLADEQPSTAAATPTEADATADAVGQETATGPATGSDYAAGVKAYEAGDYAATLRELRAGAERGHAEAQYYLGLMYANGEGVAADHAQAVAWFRKAAEKGLADAQVVLGDAYAREQLEQAVARAAEAQGRVGDSTRTDTVKAGCEKQVGFAGALRRRSSSTKEPSLALRVVQSTRSRAEAGSAAHCRGLLRAGERSAEQGVVGLVGAACIVQGIVSARRGASRRSTALRSEAPTQAPV